MGVSPSMESLERLLLVLGEGLQLGTKRLHGDDDDLEWRQLHRDRGMAAIGGIAANAHGSRRLTLDVDIIPKPDTQNYEQLAAALDELDAPQTAIDLARADVLKLPTSVGDLDVVNGAPGAPRRPVLVVAPNCPGRALRIIQGF